MNQHHAGSASNGGAANGDPPHPQGAAAPERAAASSPPDAVAHPPLARPPATAGGSVAGVPHLPTNSPPETRVDSAHAEGAENGTSPRGRMRVNLEFDFPSDVDYIERVVAVVIRQCEEFAFTPRQCALNVPVALTEALSNAILRGNKDDRRKQVRVRARVDDRELVMEVADEGAGFDFDRCMGDPTAPENISREDGRGLYLMRRLMDRVERFNDRGNVVRLTLRRG